MVKVTGNPEPQPEGSFGKRYEDLVPPDATVQQYDANRFSLITGLVQDLAGSPISDVSVTILHHPEYGTVSTDTDGRFSIPVEGGATMTFVYQKDGLLTSQRQVYVSWNDIAIAETIVMIAEDPVSTTVTFDGSPDTVVTHRSTEVTDEFGARSCTTVFTGDNLAYLLDEDGNDIHALTTITTRATEYTTLESMPAILPPTSAYTYCVELSVDGAQRVRFDKPVIIWVDNFIGFDVGEIVPVGYYDRDRGVWVPSDNGVVVRLLDTNADGVVDALDADGDEQPDDLDGDGSFSDEVTGLDDPEQYAPRSTFWRAAIAHFTPCDLNWPYGPEEDDAISANPGGEPDADEQEEKDCKRSFNSFVEERSRIFHEDIPIPGTDMTLHYASNRVEGYKTVITVPASGETVPSSLKAIIVEVEVAGRTLKETLDPLPKQKVEFVWDWLDHLERPVNGTTVAQVSIGFEYKTVYYSAREDLEQSFAQAGGYATLIPGREAVIFWKRSHFFVNKGGNDMADGWTLSPHHHLSLRGTLFKGDGTMIRNSASASAGAGVGIITTVAGNGTEGYSGDRGPATNAELNLATNVVVDTCGNLYISDQLNHRVRKVDTNGIITTVAGNGTDGDSGDGGAATAAQLSRPAGLALDTRDNLYISDYESHRVRKVNRNGIITTVAGNGTQGFSGGGGPGTDAQLSHPNGLAVDASGNLYIADGFNHSIRKVDVNGIITLVAGHVFPGDRGDGGLAIHARFREPVGVAVDADGSLYIADYRNHRVRKVDATGIITTVAGNGTAGYNGDCGPATAAQLFGPTGVTLDASGNLYISERYNNCIRKVDTNGIITTVAGNGTAGYGGDRGLAIDASLDSPIDVALDASGNLYIADFWNHCIRKVMTYDHTLPGATTEDICFVEEKGLGHIMSKDGLHKKTIDLDTGVVVREFAYDEDNKLVSITDRFGNETTIDVGDSITSPDGLTTILSIDNNNHLTRITYPDGSSYRFDYNSKGLMTGEVEPAGNRFDHQFDYNGRLTDVTDDEGGHLHLSRTVYEDGDILAQVTTGEGNVTSYLDHTESAGKYTSTITDPTGAETLFDRSANGLSVNKSLACGMELDFEYDIDPKYLFKYVKKMTERTPSGLGKVTCREKTYQPADSDEFPDRSTEQVTVNGKASTHVIDSLQATKTLTSPEGRIVSNLCDPDTFLTTRLTIAGLYDTDYGYDSSGRLTSISTNTRETFFSYNGHGFLESVTDPEDHTTTYTHDAVGRVAGISRPDGASLGFTYDQNGNMTVLTNPSTIDHSFGYNGVNLKSFYQPPISGSYSYVYDKDRRLVQTNFPSGNQINNIYNKTRLVQIQTPEGDIDFTYVCGTKVESIANGTETITYGYDGTLLASETMSGTLSESLGYTYYDDFNLQSFTYAGNIHIYMYDDDDLLTGTGRFGILRNAGL